MEAGPNLKARLLHSENKIIPIRNKFSHRVPALRSGSQTIHFVTTANLQEIPQRKEGGEGETCLSDVTRHGPTALISLSPESLRS